MKRYSKQGLWSLFLIGAFPLHVWTLILGFRDFSWLAERTNSWDAIGVISYGLLLAFFESIILFLVMALLGLLISKKWIEDQRITLLGNLVLVASLWAILAQLFFLSPITIPGQVIDFLVQLSHPLRFLYAVGLALVGLTVSISTYFVLRSEKYLQTMRELFERLSLLTLLYLFFDVVGLIIVIIRN